MKTINMKPVYLQDVPILVCRTKLGGKTYKSKKILSKKQRKTKNATRKQKTTRIQKTIKNNTND